MQPQTTLIICESCKRSRSGRCAAHAQVIVMPATAWPLTPVTVFPSTTASAG